MKLHDLVDTVTKKASFVHLDNYTEFCKKYLEFTSTGLQAVIVSQNERHYQFYQYKEDGNYNISRPINSKLMYQPPDLDEIDAFIQLLPNVRDIPVADTANRARIVRAIYTIQQSIGVALDALPAGRSNTARKLNGDLFERFIQLILKEVGIVCNTGIVRVPVSVDNTVQFYMSYQHDLLIYNQNQLKVIGSVKTSSKDRIDKIFMDKFLYCKLTDTDLPHIAVFLNDVQRKATKREEVYAVNSTFLSGHFKAFTVKLNPLNGVYYCDMRPIMTQDSLLNQHIKTIDHLLCSDVWELLQSDGLPLKSIRVEEEIV